MGEWNKSMSPWKRKKQLKCSTQIEKLIHAFFEIDDGGYQIAMAFRFSLMHSQKLCKSFIFRCSYLQYTRIFILCHYLNLWWETLDFNVKMCEIYAFL